jgi:DNA gyrase subunit A
MGRRKGDEVIATDVVGNNEGDLLVVTENGYGKRTKLADYPRKGRGGLGVKTAQLVEGKGRLVGARVVREGYQVMLISTGGTVIKMAVDDIKRSGRSTQGVIVMRFKTDDERVSALAPVVESEEAEPAEESALEPTPVAPSA